MKRLRHSHLVPSIGTRAMKLCTEASLSASFTVTTTYTEN
jgi:hypothetical protein